MIRQHQGFTLLEVMVALAILAVVAVSASQASRSYISSVDTMKTRTLAYYVAQNTLADLRIQQSWLNGTDTKQIQAQGRQWQVSIAPNSTSNANQNLKIQQAISIGVAPIIEGSVKNNLVTIDAVLLKPEEPHP